MREPEKPYKEYRTIRLPIAKENYEEFISNSKYAKNEINALFQQYPELFPSEMRDGYVLYGFTDFSRKLGLRCRRIQLKADKSVFTIAPSFVLPYMRAKTSEVENALFLRRF